MAADYHTDAAVHAHVEQALDELFAQVLAWGGVITGEHGIGLAKARWFPAATSEVSPGSASRPQNGARSPRHPQSREVRQLNPRGRAGG